jgi:hypothetical protein
VIRFWLALARRGLRRSPRAIAARLRVEVASELERLRAPGRGRRFTDRELLVATGARSVGELWEASQARPFSASDVSLTDLRALCPADEAAIIERADRALLRDVDLLGSGSVRLGEPITWSKDYKSGIAWPRGFARRIVYVNPADTSDVKLPWELSRVQWLVPVGQAYALTGDERYARAVREILEDWMVRNPYAMTINWAVAMEAALRIVSWTWLFHAFASSSEWRDAGFRSRFLRALYLHGDWVERNLERSDVNGNHYTADAAGLVFAGLFFGQGQAPVRWARRGWEILGDEISKQVLDDGVDFEASTAYHRLVAELFLLPALVRERLGQPTPDHYRERLIAMARFVAAYSRDDGSSPRWGDADDGRALPLGTQPLGDHRYLVGLAGAVFGVGELERQFAGPLGEVLWLLGPAAAARLASAGRGPDPRSTAFADAGAYVMRSPRDHVFVDAGPVGMRGRGGHGHNDCLSFEAVLDGALLIVDPGTYVYTASYEWRNRFRSTAYHNTPVIDEQEQNRIIDPTYLWSLHEDARPTVWRWSSTSELDVLRASHSGYRRLPRPVVPVRTIALDKRLHRLLVRDDFDGAGDHAVRIPYHIDESARLSQLDTGVVRVEADGRGFELHWSGDDLWHVAVRDGWVSPSYGVKRPAQVLELTRAGPLAPVSVVIAPAGSDRDELLGWAATIPAAEADADR